MSRRVASNAQNDTDSVIRRPSRFADHSASLPRWRLSDDRPPQPHRNATITEETEFTGMSGQYDGTRTSQLLGRTRTATLPRHTRFENPAFPGHPNPRDPAAMPPTSRNVKPTSRPAAVYDITETSHITVLSSAGPDATENSIHVTKRSDEDRSDLAETADWLYSRRNDAAEDMRQRLEKLRTHVPADRDITGTSNTRTRPARVTSTRFRQIINVPVPPEEDEIYGALQRIEERLEALEEVTGTQPPPAKAKTPSKPVEEPNITELSRMEDANAHQEAAVEPNITELSRVEVDDSDGGDLTQLEPFNTEQLDDLRRRIEEDYDPQRHERRQNTTAKGNTKANTKVSAEVGREQTSTKQSMGAGAGKAATTNKPSASVGTDRITSAAKAPAEAETTRRPTTSKPSANVRAERVAASRPPPPRESDRAPAAKSSRDPAAVRLVRLYRSVEAEHFELCAELATASDRLIGQNPARADEPGLAVDTERVRRLAELVAAKKRQLRLAH